MSIESRLVNAKEVDIFSELSQEEKMEADLLADIAMQIHTRRTEMGMTQAEFARYMGVAQTMVSKWESGSYNFTLQKLVQIYSKLGLSFGFDVSKQEEIPVENKVVQPKKAISSWQYETTKSSIWDNRTTPPAGYGYV